MGFNGSFFGGFGGGAAGSSEIADWRNLAASDMSTDSGGYTTFTLGASSQSGYNLKVNIGCDLSVTTKQFPYTTAAVIYFDTGIKNADIADGDSRIITVQTMLEMYGLEQGGTIRSDTTHEQSIVPFVTSADGFPFQAGDNGMMGVGVTLEGGNVTKILRKALRSNSSTVGSGVIVGSTATLLALTHNVTLTMRDNPNHANACFYSADHAAFWDNSGSNAIAAAVANDRHSDPNGNAFAAADDTLKVGVAFHMNKTQDASNVEEWNLNFKYRILKTTTS